MLSTVSGGGYTGSLLTRLFSRKWVKGHDDVRQAILPARGSSEEDVLTTSEESSAPRIRPGAVLRWLRDNGRYLAPNGSEVLLNGAILFRNWLSVHIVLMTFILALFVFMQALRGKADEVLSNAGVPVLSGCVGDFNSSASVETWLTCHLPFGETYLWWSPVLLAPAVVVIVAVVPLGWLYWFAVANEKSLTQRWAGLVLPAMLLYATHEWGLPAIVRWVLILAMLVQVCVFCALWPPCFSRRDERRTETKVHRWLSSRFSEALTISAMLLVLALVDTLGQTIYVLWRMPGSFVYPWFAAGFTGVVAAFAGARWLAAYFSGPRGPRLRAPLSIAAGVGGFLLIAAWLVTINVGAHAIAWRLDFPQQVPEKLFATRVSEAGGCTRPVSCRELATFRCPQDCPALGQRDNMHTLGMGLFLAGLTLLFGWCWSFLNDSSLLPLYTARLTRAYLGASNPKRLGCQPRTPVTGVLDDDDMPLEWSGHVKDVGNDDPYRKGAPLHLINVTINETLDGKLKLQQSGRKGIGMAVGPAGLSAGVRHHVVLGQTMEEPIVCPRHGYRMFSYDGGEFNGTKLSFGQWVGISGAAFSTGLGRRTRLGLSLLAGFFNVRMGFWWDSGIDPSTRREAVPRTGCVARLEALFACIFPVQSYLLDEFLGRFHGSARRHWCFTDGGHFDNTGVYELLRRRVPLIVGVDAEADPDYRFDGLGNLVRKARADFDAEIEFLDDSALSLWAEDRPDALQHVRALEDLRSGGHAAVAVVRYGGAREPASVFVYLKPTLVGDEPADIRHYRSENPDFPHEGTVDQFFDEAQWESYRRLGELIAERVVNDEAFALFCKKAGLAAL